MVHGQRREVHGRRGSSRVDRTIDAHGVHLYVPIVVKRARRWRPGRVGVKPNRRTVAVVTLIIAAIVVVIAFNSWNPRHWDWDRIAEVAVIVGLGLVVVLFAVTMILIWENLGDIVSARGAALTVAYESVWALLLAIVAVDYLRQDPIAIAKTLGPVPTPVLWFGAVGGMLIALSGIADHTADGSWNDRWVVWHLLRPLVGVVVGVIAVLTFQAGILSIGANPNPTGKSGTAPRTQDVTFYVIAFIVAYREATFRDLIKRLADVVFTTGPARPTISGVVPPGGAGGQVAITGSGLSSVTTVRFGKATATITGQSDGSISVTAPARAAATDDATPKLAVPVVVDGPSGSAASTYVYD
jgi:hypothetical protein